MPTFEAHNAVLNSITSPDMRKGEAPQIRIVITMPLGSNREIWNLAPDWRKNVMLVAFTPLQIELPEDEPQPTPLPERRRGRRASSNGHTPEASEPAPDPAEIPHGYQAPTSMPGGDCTVCGTGPNADIHAEGQLSPTAASLIDSIIDPPADE